VIRAAGGVVMRVRHQPDGPTSADPLASLEAHDGIEVLVVHRVVHGDWSLPKGHVDDGESDAVAAVREVHEETGVRAEVIAPLRATEHATSVGRKQVQWFLMRVVEGDPSERVADDEVDVTRFVPVGELAALLTYPADLGVVDEAIRHHPSSVTHGGSDRGIDA
jgi:8-oxo-dGTP pyrophosphatase MutT (NUDIX family)